MDDGVAREYVWFATVGGVKYGPFDTQAAAWKYYDRVKGDPETPAESRSAFWLRQSANGQ